MGHEWKVGDWAEFDGNRYLVWDVSKDKVYGIPRNGFAMSLAKEDAKHLPDCTGWCCEEPKAKEVEPAAHEWKFGDWAHSPIGIVRFVCKEDQDGGWCVSKDNLLDCFQILYLAYLPDCTGFDWNHPIWNPVKPTAIQPPHGYRLMNADETIRHGNMFFQSGAWNDTGIGVSEIAVGEALKKYARYKITAYACRIEADAFETELKYRPFANAEEFMPHRDRWIVDNDGEMLRAISFDAKRSTIATRYGPVHFLDAFSRFKFEDGTPFGVLES